MTTDRAVIATEAVFDSQAGRPDRPDPRGPGDSIPQEAADQASSWDRAFREFRSDQAVKDARCRPVRNKTGCHSRVDEAEVQVEALGVVE
jgi:hypothetical protein